MSLLHQRSLSGKNVPNWVVILRLVLGICLVYKGFDFIQNKDQLISYFEHSKTLSNFTGFITILPWVHIIGGLLIFVGLFTRLMSLIQIPILLGAVVFLLAFASSYYLTWRKACKAGLPVWDHTSKRLAWNMLVPLMAGGAFIIGMLRYDVWIFVAPACLMFYGLALVNASKYTLSDIRYLGYCEIVLGTVNMLYPGYGLWFWAAGFGVLHIIYGVIMWNKYERNN